MVSAPTLVVWVLFDASYSNDSKTQVSRCAKERGTRWVKVHRFSTHVICMIDAGTS